jgi:phage-related protein
MKPIEFLGDSLERLREFPPEIRQTAGYELDQVQHGQNPHDWKPMPAVGAGVREIRVRDDTEIARVFYVAKFAEAVYVLHAFVKKDRTTRKTDIRLGRERYAELVRRRR